MTWSEPASDPAPTGQRRRRITGLGPAARRLRRHRDLRGRHGSDARIDGPAVRHRALPVIDLGDEPFVVETDDLDLDRAEAAQLRRDLAEAVLNAG